MENKTLVFGTSGFLGSVFMEHHPHLISAGRTVPSIVPNAKCPITHIDIPHMDALKKLDNIEFDNVIFLVGNSNHHMLNSDCIQAINYNVVPLKKMLHYLATRKQPIKKFVCLTSILLYGNEPKGRPVNEKDETFGFTNEYIFSKYLAEQVVKYYSSQSSIVPSAECRIPIPIINVRISNIYGSTSLVRPDLVPTLMQDALTKPNPTVWNDTPVRDFVYAPDACEAILKLIETDYTGTVNLGSGTQHSVRDVCNVIEELSGKKITSLNKPVSGVMNFVTDISLLQSLTGWKPRHTLKEGLTTTYNGMKKILEEKRK